GLDISVAEISRLRTSLRPIGAASVIGAWVDHRVAWRGVWPSTDVLLVAGARFTEYAMFLRDETAPHKFSFAVANPAGITGSRLDESGDLVLVDAHDVPALRVRVPFVIDAHGEKRAGHVQLVGQTLTVEFDPTGLAYPMVLDPTVDVPSWLKIHSTYPESPEG